MYGYDIIQMEQCDIGIHTEQWHVRTTKSVAILRLVLSQHDTVMLSPCYDGFGII